MQSPQFAGRAGSGGAGSRDERADEAVPDKIVRRPILGFWLLDSGYISVTSAARSMKMRRLWRFADERGFDWFSVSDHFQETPPQGGDVDCFESVSTMAALAAETTHVRVGCLVFCAAYRHPGVLAKAITTIDHLSGGRVDCGIG